MRDTGKELEKINGEIREANGEIREAIEDLKHICGNSAYKMVYGIVKRYLENISFNCKRTADEITKNKNVIETGVVIAEARSQIEFLGKIYSDTETAKDVCESIVDLMVVKLDMLERENRELKAKNVGNEKAEKGEENIPNAEAEAGKSKEDEDEKGTHYCFGTYNLNSLRCAANCCLNRMCKEETETRRKWNEWESGREE